VQDYFPLCENYTIYLMMRKIGLSPGATTETMAKDYAIRTDFGGHVDAIIGYSYGGLIAQHFAADYPQLCQKIIFQSATNENTDQGEKIDTLFAQYLIEGKKGKAFALMMDVIVEPGLRRVLMKVLLRCIGPLIPLAKYPEFASDVKIELEAELNHDAGRKFKTISIPVLILIGTKDYYFSVQSAEWMAEQIPQSTLAILHDTGHESAKHEHFIKYIKKYLQIPD
jgi:pimeloyl-ACP methyl ester carboxylesterase